MSSVNNTVVSLIFWLWDNLSKIDDKTKNANFADYIKKGSLPINLFGFPEYFFSFAKRVICEESNLYIFQSI